MTDDTHKKSGAEPGPEAKTRRCLIGKTPFLSAWAGERICRRCKGKCQKVAYRYRLAQLITSVGVIRMIDRPWRLCVRPPNDRGRGA